MARQPIANPAPTFSKEALAALIAEATATALAKQRAEFEAAMQTMAAKTPATNGKPSKSAENEAKTIRAFAKAGFGKVVPRVDVKTFNLWKADGLRPKEGTKALKINNLRLFHRSQLRPMTAAELKVEKEQSVATEKRQKSGKVIPISGEASPQ